MKHTFLPEIILAALTIALGMVMMGAAYLQALEDQHNADLNDAYWNMRYNMEYPDAYNDAMFGRADYLDMLSPQ